MTREDMNRERMNHREMEGGRVATECFDGTTLREREWDDETFYKAGGPYPTALFFCTQREPGAVCLRLGVGEDNTKARNKMQRLGALSPPGGGQRERVDKVASGKLATSWGVPGDLSPGEVPCVLPRPRRGFSFFL